MKVKEEQTKMVSVRVPKNIFEALEKIGAEDERSVSWLMRKAAIEFVEKKTGKK